MSSDRTICLLAGDVSGDQHAASLARAIREQAPDVRLIGGGGPAMAAAGIEVAWYTTHLSFTGVLASLRIMRELIALFRRVRRFVLDERPDLVVLVDAEVLTLPVATWLRGQGVPVLFYFPPQAWLWARWRLPLIVPLVRRVLSAFPDEADLYRRAGADTIFTGHPLRDLVRVDEDPGIAVREIGLDPARPLVVLMPGSRRSEIHRLAAPMLGAARRLHAREPALQFALPLATESLRSDVEHHVRASRAPNVVVYRPRSHAVLSHARVALQSSGTATLETALLGVPSVITYRCIPIEYVFARLFMSVPFIGMPNILLGEMVQPEFFQRHVDAEHLADAAWSLVTDEQRRRAIRARLAEIPTFLGPTGVVSRAARAVLELLPRSGEQSAVCPAEWDPSSASLAVTQSASEFPRGRRAASDAQAAG